MKKHLRWIRNRHQARSRHFKNTDFVCCAKPVLSRAHNPMVMMSLAFEIQHRVYDVFECFGTGKGTFLRDMSDKEHRHTAVLCKHQKLLRHFSDL